MSKTEIRTTPKGTAKQKQEFRSGNEAAAIAGKDIGFHVMGYFPITPSTEVAEGLAKMQANGEHDVVMIAGDGEHGAAGICYGAALGGGRVLNATSAQGILFAMEQLPVQSGTRQPMVLDIACRTVSAPLDIRGDHSDIYMALNTGWIMLLARDPQAAYDMNFCAVRIGEHKDVQLPVMVCYDGFFTSHQKRRLWVFDDPAAVKKFLGSRNAPMTALDPAHPVTFGPYMNDPDLINNKKQLSDAMEAARSVIPQVFKEFGELTGRFYPVLDEYRMADADSALVIANSAAETAKEVADRMRDKGNKVGVLSPNVLRPFPGDLFRAALKKTKACLIGDRADSYGGEGGNLTTEVRAAIQQDPDNHTRTISKIYGLGGRDFYAHDAEAFFAETIEAAKTGKVGKANDYYGLTEGEPSKHPAMGLPPLTTEEVTRHMAKVTVDETTGRLKVDLEPLWAMTAMPSRVAPGHGACPGCGIFPSLQQAYRVIDGDLIVLFHTGCAMVVTTGYPTTAHRITYVHNLFQNGAATLSGLVEMYHERSRRGELPNVKDPTFLMVSGDGGMDIGMGPTLGAAHRGHKMIVLEYDNQAYMNTGAQLSYETPMGHRTSTSEVGAKLPGKTYHHKDTVQMFAATHIPYVFQASEGYPEDFMRKMAKAQWYAKHEGFVFGKVLSYCPLNWRTADDAAQPVLQAAADSCFFPLYEVEKGKTTITYDPDAIGRRIPHSDWLKMMGKTRHLMKNEALLKEAQAEVDRRWRRLKAMHAHPEL
ncbi:MAG: thiamine pyrophosphate-dependent enzyme [Candidatus Coatesbacteria bacterium]